MADNLANLYIDNKWLQISLYNNNKSYFMKKYCKNNFNNRFKLQLITTYHL